MLKTVRFRKQALAWQQQFNALAPQVGDMASDFELRDVSGEHPVRLSDFRGRRPVALVFGSFT